MTSVVNDVIDQIVTDWEAHAPPDRTLVTYHEVDGKRFLDGTSGDRSFMFDVERTGVVGECGSALSQVEWSVTIKLRLSQGPRNQKSLRAAIANEGNLLARLIELRSVWPSGTIEVITGPVRAERELDGKGDALVTFELQITTAETDT